MKQVEASAKTREEAIQNALKDLGVEMYEVDKIEVLDEGSKGLFGFGARPVKVRLIVENMPDEPQREERPRRTNNRGRGGERGQGRDSREGRGDRKERSGNRNGGRGERKERSGNAEARGEQNGEREERGRGRGDKSRNDRGNRSRNARTEEGNEATAANESGNDTSNESPSRNRSDKEVSPSRGARNRNRKREDRPEREERPERSERPKRKERPVAEATTPPAEGDEAPVDGIAADAIEPISDAQGNEAAALLEEIISNMGIEAKAAFTRSEDGSARLNVTSEDSAILIGRKGRNLSAMQYLINRMISRGDTNESSERLVVDVEGYVDRRRETLQDMARSMAEKAKESNRNMRLKPLSPQERRIVHLTLQEDEDIRTFSLGESLYRSVVISPKGAAQPERNRSRGGRGGRGRRRGGRDRNQDQRSGRNRPAEQDVDAGTFGD